MCARHHSFRNICEMTRMPIVLICLTTVCIQILNNCVVADELQQQQSQRLDDEFIEKIAVIGANFTLSCETSTTQPFKWRKDSINITDADKRYLLTIDESRSPDVRYNLTIKNVSANDTGIFICEQHGSIDGEEQPIKQQYKVTAVTLPHITEVSSARIYANISQNVVLYCVIEAHPMLDFRKTIKWTKEDGDNSKPKSNNQELKDVQAAIINDTIIHDINDHLVNVTLNLNDINKRDNGSYSCTIDIPMSLPSAPVFAGFKTKLFTSSVFVLSVPQISLDFVKAVGSSQIYMNWTVNDGNAPITTYFVQYLEGEDSTFTYYAHSIAGTNSSFVLQNFKPNTTYQLKISAKNGIGSSSTYTYAHKIHTLDFDPVFVPVIEVKGSSHSSISLSWNAPPTKLQEFIHYYDLLGEEKKNETNIIREIIYPQNSRNLPNMIGNLKTATEYTFRVRACSELTKQCGNWSTNVTGTTSDGTASAPINLRAYCVHYNSSGLTIISAEWEPPINRNGMIQSYSVELSGMASYRNGRNLGIRNETYGPKSKVVDARSLQTQYDKVPLNTNFTIKVFAKTRSKQQGIAATATCSTPRSIPSNITSSIKWKNWKVDGKNVFKLTMPEMNERNGPICGYRIYMVRLPQQADVDANNLKPVDKLFISTYDEVHNEKNTQGGAYIAETVSREELVDGVVILGDQEMIRLNKDGYRNVANEACRKLLNGYIERRANATTAGIVRVPVTTKKPVIDDDIEPTAEVKIEKTRRRRQTRHHSRRQTASNAIEIENPENGKATTAPKAEAPRAEESIQIVHEVADNLADARIVYDGQLDPESKYTTFIEVIVNIDDKGNIESGFSDYADPLDGQTTDERFSDDSMELTLNILTQIMCALIVLVLILLGTLCVMHRVHSRKQQGHDVISLRDSLSRAICGGRNNQSHRHLLGQNHTKPADFGPIPRDELSPAYVQRHKDTDYGFLSEFELLPNRFNDRTTKASDSRENTCKNRYPDIKAYDQTRVRLAERVLNGSTTGSDYINANFVLGYKERKKFICAQGPMDSTVNDFWRMIWEQHLEIIVMLTNLEEYNKAKCAKYWPEQVNDTTKFGEITVNFVHEQRYSDYLVRELKITRSHSMHNNSINSNGNGGLNAGSGSGTEDEEERHITQYHYLAWKDFMAPELGVIRFIRQINDVYSVQRGPILIHCSAGVGRTGTLVALDSLMQQLQDENQVSIFNTVYDLRHQRNFLVQSLKQYIFLYRALLDVAQFGNTEIPFKDLPTTMEQLKQRSNDSRDQCKLEIEFEKVKGFLDETSKSSDVGVNDENRNKNRSESVIPYDRNRVILTPNGPQQSSYINATFIEGYDNSESFIITQDPLEETIGDFWRMVSEQSIHTIVMISEIGDGPRKCPRYWADDEIEYGHILVKYMQSESCPYYTRREFNVTNFKMKDTIKVTQFQYNGWPTVEGEVPEVARGMLELVDQTLNLQENSTFAYSSPIVVHCSLGTDRSSIFVTLSILVQQLRLEKKVDVCTVVRKLRTQRSQFLSTYAQYEFVCRAIANYADLHKNDLDSSPSPSVKTNS